MSMLSKESGGTYNVDCFGKDIQNYLSNQRRQLLRERHTQSL